jgi:hypothetical protein
MSKIEANITCPHCHAAFSMALEAMSPGKSGQCPHCGATIKFAGQDGSKIQEALDQLGDKLKDTPIKVTVKTKQLRPWWKFWSA